MFGLAQAASLPQAAGQMSPSSRELAPVAAGLRAPVVIKDNGMECRQAGRDLHLHVHRASLDPLKRYGGNPLDHAAPLPRWKVAEGRRQGRLCTLQTMTTQKG